MDLAEKAKELGFDVVGITSATLAPTIGKGLQEFLLNGHHGDMGWMEARADQRSSPDKLWPEAKSIIMLGHNYAPDHNPLDTLKQKHIGNISVYARNADYHDVIKKRLKHMARWLVETQGGDVKVFVDTAPLMEKPLAEAAGLGWQGKHTCIVSREFGSWLFLGAIATTLDLAPSEPEINHCGSCTACIDICPTGAIIAPGKLDARKCISYLTIEHKGSIPIEYRKAIGNRIYGCDDCLAVCPWNKFASEAKETAYHAREELKAPKLTELVTLDDAAFRKLFAKSPIKRIGRDRFIRNVLIAIGNTEDASYAPLITPLLNDPNEIISETAQWALSSLRA